MVLKKELVGAVSLPAFLTAITRVANLFYSKKQLIDKFQETVSPCQPHSCCFGGWMPIFGNRSGEFYLYPI